MLNLGYNKLSGSISKNLGQLSSLVTLRLDENRWEAIITEAHLMHLSSLKELTISAPTTSLAFNISSDWEPPFKLERIYVHSVRLGPEFPNWLKNQTELIGVALPKAGISGNIPDWFTDMILQLDYLNLSGNQISGEIPQIWDKVPHFEALFMSNNRLTGTIPSSIGTLTSLQILALSGNNLSGELPPSLRNCTNLRLLDVGDNQLSGNLQMWLGDGMPSLSILRLRNNSFTGNIPLQLCSFPLLHLLDLSKNNLSGQIPPCIGNLSGFKSTTDAVPGWKWELQAVTKGSSLLFNSILSRFLNSIDLSENNLDGEIPPIITCLSELDTLNLSRNHFTGNIPSDIGSLKLLESLDLSVNQLSGPIPTSMASLTMLNHLNLSRNNLSGHIPTSTQLQTLNDPSIYLGNAALCGSPLITKCANEISITDGNGEKEDNVEADDVELEDLKLFAVGGLGFILGFWGACGTLIIKKRWRDAYFHFLERIRCKICKVLIPN